ncbi:MAG: hypothetical protein LBR80_02625 [Deltaproteobacteria bacterium]|nr:hypothetical protein [Deltaproteobacteria bacterium]
MTLPFSLTTVRALPGKSDGLSAPLSGGGSGPASGPSLDLRTRFPCRAAGDLRGGRDSACPGRGRQ